MALIYCEICGVLLQQPGSGADPEGVICDDCFASRQAVVSGEEEVAEPAAPAYVQFECVYCRSLLRLPAVAHRTSVKCPQCREAFFLCPDGRVEARLEGNTTQILDKDHTLRALTPPAENPDRTQALGRPHAKTQPVSPVSETQRAALRDLAEKNRDLIQELPPRLVLPVDTRRRERLLRQRAETRDFEPVDLGSDTQERRSLAKADTAELPPEARQALRASDEGRIDLDASALRAKAGDTAAVPPSAPAGGAGLRAKAPRKRRSASERFAGVRKDAAAKERRAAQAVERVVEIERGKARSALRAFLLWLVYLLPLAASALALSMTTRRAGLLMQDGPRAVLERSGERVRAGARALLERLPAPARAVLAGNSAPSSDAADSGDSPDRSPGSGDSPDRSPGSGDPAGGSPGSGDPAGGSPGSGDPAGGSPG
ncbi:MAG: hypothetical protein D6731_05585, partial [Planctomycetota bacterium]